MFSSYARTSLQIEFFLGGDRVIVKEHFSGVLPEQPNSARDTYCSGQNLFADSCIFVSYIFCFVFLLLVLRHNNSKNVCSFNQNNDNPLQSCL